jgi:uncharacterized membrane protein YphA (DoxX/SURF4 family)
MTIMKTTKIIYWITTALLGLMMLFSGYTYLTNPDMKTGFAHLGFPDYFRVELAFAKIVGGLVLLVPIESRVKEWAYSGFAISFISAIIAHTSSGDPAANVAGPVIALVLLATSYVTYQKIKDQFTLLRHS